jgi:hypothetical protein
MLIEGLPGPKIARAVALPEATAYPVLVQLFMNHLKHFARSTMGMEESVHIADHIPHIAWIWAKRRTKPATEARAIQEALISVVDITRQYLEDTTSFAEIPDRAADWGRLLKKNEN